MRIAFTDGEMSNLAADGFGQLLCAVVGEYRPLSAKQMKIGRPPWINIQSYTLDDYKGRRWDDRGLAVRWRNALEEFDLVVTWNGIKFDIPFLNTRLSEYDEREVKLAHHKDLMYTARFRLRLASASLAAVAQHYRIDDKYGVGKTPLKKTAWRKAIGGHAPSYGYIINHCEEDVKVLAALWQEMKHLVTEIK